MIIENEDALKEWLGKRLEPICDADPHALSKYVTALLRKDKSKDDLHSICVDQLEVFLQGETVQFVNDLFKQLDSKDYLRPKSERVEKKPVSRSPSPRKRRSVSRSPEKRRDYTPERRKRRERSPSPRRRSRSPRERKMKKERSRSREKKHKRDRHRTASEEEERRAHKKAKKQKKSKDREESPLGNITRTINVTKSKECPEYAETGICKQGNCTLEHSGALVTIENESTPKKESTPAANVFFTPGFPIPPPIGGILPSFPGFPNPGALYDPSMPGIGLPPMPVPPPGASNGTHHAASAIAMAAAAAATKAVQQTMNPQLDIRGAQHQMNSFKQRRHPRGGPTGAPDPLKLQVTSVPEQLNNITKLNEHFSKFGVIKNILVNVEKNMATIEFTTAEACQAALNSPDPVLNNKFIQMRQFLNRQGVKQLVAVPIKDKLADMKANKSGNKTDLPIGISAEIQAEARARIEAARDAIKNRSSVQKQQQKNAKVQLLQEQRSLLEKQINQQKRLVEKLQDPATGQAQKPDLLKTLKALASNTDEMRNRVKALETEIFDEEKKNKVENDIKILEAEIQRCSGTGEDTQAVRLKLYNLQDEARKLGIFKRKAAVRGGMRGRGRGRGRAGLIQRVNQKNSEYIAAGASVDRRPRRLKISGFNEDEMEDVIVHLADIGEIEFLDTLEDGFFIITVQYRTRADAELAATQGSRFKNKKLIVVWQKNEDSETKTEKKHQNEEDELLYSDDENNTANEKVEQQIANDEELLEELA